MSVDIKPTTKIGRILEHLINGHSLNLFEAERIGDHTLRSTISTLANRHGLMIQRQSESVPNGWGGPSIATRYSLPISEHKRARLVLLAMISRQSKGANDDN